MRQRAQPFYFDADPLVWFNLVLRAQQAFHNNKTVTPWVITQAATAAIASRLLVNQLRGHGWKFGRLQRLFRCCEIHVKSQSDSSFLIKQPHLIDCVLCWVTLVLGRAQASQTEGQTGVQYVFRRLHMCLDKPCVAVTGRIVHICDQTCDVCAAASGKQQSPSFCRSGGMCNRT